MLIHFVVESLDFWKRQPPAPIPTCSEHSLTTVFLLLTFMLPPVDTRPHRRHPTRLPGNLPNHRLSYRKIFLFYSPPPEKHATTIVAESKKQKKLQMQTPQERGSYFICKKKKVVIKILVSDKSFFDSTYIEPLILAMTQSGD